MRKFWLIGIVMLLALAIPSLACLEGHQCPPVIQEWSVNPCTNGLINSSTQMQVSVNATACYTGDFGGICTYLYDTQCTGVAQYLPGPIGSLGQFLNKWCVKGFQWATGDGCEDAIANIANSSLCEQVNIHVVLYSNSTNAQDLGWSGWVPSFQQQDFPPYTLNNKNGSYTILIEASSASDPTPYDILEIPYITGGTPPLTQYGDCKSGAGVVPISRSGYSIPIIFNGFGGGWTGSLLWFILMIVVAGAILFITGTKTRAGTDSFQIGLGITAFAELVLAFIGAFFSLISWLWLVVFVVLFAVWVWTKVQKMFTASD